MIAEPATEIEIAEPAGRVNHLKRKRGGVSPKRLDRAARELNLIRVDARGLLNISTVGRFLDQVGMLHYGNGRMLASAAMIADAAERCGKLAALDTIGDEVRQGYLTLQLKFIQALDENVELHLQLNNAPAGESRRGNAPPPMPSKPFLPGAAISPINLQVNVNGQTATVTEKKVEEPCPSSS